MTVIVSIPFFRQGWDPIRADIPLFVDRDIFLQFLPILQPPCLHWHPIFVKGHGPQAIGCEVHVSLLGQPHLAPGYEASWPAWQAPESLSSRFHPQSVPFCEPKAFVVHLGKQQPVE